MQTYSHLILTATLNHFLKHKSNPMPPLKTGAFLLGSVAPDIPLTSLAVAIGAYDTLKSNLSHSEKAALGKANLNKVCGDAKTKQESNLSKLFGDWFYHNPFVITLQNLFHSPLLVTLYLLIGFVGWKLNARWGARLFWFALGCLLHTLIDIPLHHDDGPLLLFPLNWSQRFYSPISYWDKKHHGATWALFEHLLDLALLIFLLVAYQRHTSG